MTNIILCGCGGRLGKALTAAAQNEYDIIAGVDINATSLGALCPFPVYESIKDFSGKADAIIDFSHHSALASLIEYSKATKTPLVIATTGHTDEERELMEEAAKETAIFFSRNMSIGINLLIEFCKETAAMLGEDFDIEIIEKHHNKKLDAPSGTAMMIAEALKDEREGETEFVYDRHEVRRKRSPSEIGIHAIRGGTIVGEHEVMFAGEDEIITITHSARSKRVFAVGAIRAAKFLKAQQPNMYDMQDLLKAGF